MPAEIKRRFDGHDPDQRHLLGRTNVMPFDRSTSLHYIRALSVPRMVTLGFDRPSQVIVAPLQEKPYHRLRVSRSLRSFHLA